MSFQALIKDLKMLYNDCRSNSCIEHAMVIKEEEKAPEKLSQKISTMSLNGAHKKVVVWVLYLFLEKKQNPHESRSACFNSHHLQTSIVSLCIHSIRYPQPIRYFFWWYIRNNYVQYMPFGGNGPFCLSVLHALVFSFFFINRIAISPFVLFFLK